MKVALRLYFRKIKIEGLENVPRNTPILVTPNHQNAFLDALIVGAFIPIELYYLTRSDIFLKWTAPLVKLVNMMPIYRLRDGYAKLSKNEAIFKTCKEIFKRNKSILIFAEGNHGMHYYLRPITKGAARLALQSQEVLENELNVIPVGLNYFSHQVPRSTVLIRFGEPIPVQRYLADYKPNPVKGLVKMRDAISDGMKRTLLIPEETEDYKIRKQMIFQERNADYSFDKLKYSEFKSDDVKKPKKRKHLTAKFLNPIPFLVIYLVLNRVNDIVFHPSLKFGIGLFIFPLWWIFMYMVLFLSAGTNIAILSVMVMIFGLFYSYQV